MRFKFMLAAITATSVTLHLVGAKAAPVVSGGPLTASQFVADNINSGSFLYLGSSIPVFTGSGSAVLTLASSSFANSFGYASTSYGNAVTALTNSQTTPASAAISPSYPSFVLFFRSNPSDHGRGSDADAALYTDGHTDGTDDGQANLAIYKSATGQYAFFFDDGGPGGCTLPNGQCTPLDDNDYNDLVVTYTPTATPTTVAEPLSTALFGSGLLGLGLVSHRRRAAPAHAT